MSNNIVNHEVLHASLLGLRLSGKMICGELIEYDLADVSSKMISIRSTGSFLEIGDIVYFCYYFLEGKKLINRGIVIARIVDTYHIQPIPMEDARFPFELRSKMVLDTANEQLLFPEQELPIAAIIEALNECVLAKEGMLVCLRHVVMYMSRTTILSQEEFKNLQRTVFHETLTQIYSNLNILKDALHEIVHNAKSVTQLSLGGLRQAVSSEVFVPEFKAIVQADQFDEYFTAVKQFDHKLYYNYNVIASLLPRL